MALDVIERIRRWAMVSETRKRLYDGAVWGSIAGLLPRVITLLTSYIMARHLGREAFGAYGMINNTAMTIGSVAGLGLGMTVTKYVAELRTNNVARAGRIVSLTGALSCMSAGLGALALAASATWLASRVLAAPQLAHLLRFSALTMALFSLNTYQGSVMAGLESFRVNAFLQVGGSVLQSALVLILGWRWGLDGTVMGLGFALIATVGLTQHWVIRELRSHNIKLIQTDWAKETPLIVRFSLPSLLASMLVGPVMWVCNAMLANRPGGYAELGVFNAALQWQGAVQLVPAFLGTAVLPVLSERKSASGPAASYRIMIRMMWLTTLVSLPVALGVSILSKPIMGGYGQGFQTGHWVLVWIVFSVAFSMIAIHLGNFLAAMGRMWLAFWLNMIWALLTIWSSHVFLDRGAEGLAGARCLTYAIHLLISLLVCCVIGRQTGSNHPDSAAYLTPDTARLVNA